MTDIPFPYPVLGSNGDIDGSFDVTIMMDFSIVGFYTLNCEFKLENAYFENLIKTQQAVFMVEIECGATNYRNSFSTKDKKMTISIPDDFVRGRVDVKIYICAIKDIPEYKPTGMDTELYGDDSFEIKSGEIIAIHPSTMFLADPKYDSFNAPIRSFIKLKKSTTQSKEMFVDYNDTFIEIALPEEDYKLYREIHTSSPALIHSCIVFPVLVDVLHEIQKEDSVYSGTTWFDRVKQICFDRQIDIADPVVAAQKLLGLPINRTFNWRKNEQEK